MRSPIFRWITVAVGLVLVVSGVIVGLKLVNKGTEISATFTSAVGLYPGSDVQILGVPVGKVTAVEPRGKQVLVRMELRKGQRVGADTGAVIVAPTLVSDRFVQLTEPWTSGPSLHAGATITRTAVPVEVDALYRSLNDLGQKLGPNGANKHGAISKFLTTVAANLDGQGTNINHMIRNFGDASATVSNLDQDFFATVRNLDSLSTTLLGHDKGVASANRQFAVVARYLSNDRQNAATAIRDLGGAMALLQGFIKDNRGALTRSVKALRGPTQVLVKQRKALARTVRLAPLALQNFIRAYDVKTNTLSGRGDLNELTVWSQDGNTGKTSRSAPPVLLPGTDGGQ